MPDPGWLKEAVRPYYLRWFYFPLRPEKRPDAFRDCWQYPFEKLSAKYPGLPAPLHAPVLIFYPMTDWHMRLQRTQHLVRAFAGQGFLCVYLNPHLGREFESSPVDKAHRLARLGENIFELHVRLPREPVFHDRLLAPAEEETIVEAVRRVLPRGAAAIQIPSFPLWAGVARRFREESGYPIVYDCHDLLSGFPKMSPDLVRAETALLRDADLVLFSSDGLRARYAGEVAKSLLVRNAAASFSETAAAPPPGPPLVGYVGALESWFDVEAVRAAAIANPGCRFAIAGRIDHAPVRELGALPNVDLIGEIPYDRVPEFLAQLRAALIPFLVNPLTLMTNPIKLYEYFSRGLPVVSTPLPEAQAMSDLVYIADIPAAFAAQVKRAVEEDDAARRARRKEIAARETWPARAREIGAEFPLLLGCVKR